MFRNVVFPAWELSSALSKLRPVNLSNPCDLVVIRGAGGYEHNGKHMANVQTLTISLSNVIVLVLRCVDQFSQF